MDQTPKKSNSLRISEKHHARMISRDISSALSKLPPQAIDMEEAVLGAVLIETNAINDVMGVIQPEYFYLEKHKEIFQACLDLFGRGEPNDMRMVVAELRKTGKIELVGGAYYIAELTSKISSSANIEYHARIIAEKHMLRQCIQVASAIHADGHEDTTDPFELMAFGLSELQHVLDTATVSTADIPVREVLARILKKISLRQAGETTGLSSGLSTVDDITNGLNPPDFIIIAARPGMGKALGVNEVLLTPKGWIKMRDVKVGDKVAGSDGRFYNVTGVYPQGERDTFKVIFDDQTSLVCDDEHLWFTQNRYERKNAKKGSVKTLKAIRCTLESRNKRKNHSIPYHRPIVYKKNKTPIHPYLYGAIISEGGLTSRSVKFTNPEKYIINRVSSLIPNGYFLKIGKDGLSHVIRSNDKQSSFFEFIDELRGTHSYERFVDERYMINDVESRIQLLCGLLDTDGTVVNGNPTWIEYSTTSKKLACQVIDLVRGLGGRATKSSRMGKYSGHETRLNWRVYIGFSNEVVPVSSPKHLKNYKKKQFGKKFITDVVPNGREEVQCISVDSPDHLYVTTGNTLTHNTAFVMKAALHNALQGIPVGFCSLEMSIDQLWERNLVSESEIDSDKIRKGNLDRYEWERLTNTSGQLANIPLYVDDTPAINIVQFRAKAIKLKMKHGIRLLIVDYLQLMRGVGTEQNREQEIASISRSLKAIAKQLDIPIIALSQLSRGVETRGGTKRPQLSDLRESGCLVGETRIHCLNGVNNISYLDGVKKFNIFALNKNIQNMEAKKCWRTGKSKVFEMKLSTGHSIRATKNHKFLTNSGWKRLSDIDESDMVAIPLNYSGDKKEYNEDVAYLLGAMLANGKMIERQPITYTCNTEDVGLANEVKRISEKYFDCMSRVEDNRPKYNWINAYIKSKKPISRNHRNPFVEFVEAQGIYNLRSKTKSLPQSIFSQKKSIVLSFLAGLYDNDGSIHLVTNKTRTVGSIMYSSASLELITGVQLLLQMIGVVSRIKELTNGKQIWYNIAISGHANIELFCDQVPLKSIRKKDEVLKIKNLISKTKSGWLKHFVNEEKTLAFVQIKSILPIDGIFDVYDIEVPMAHNFIANGILTHNSIEQDADIVMFLYRPEYYHITVDEDGMPTHGMCEVIIAKQRNGATGTAKVKFMGRYTKFLNWIMDDNKLSDSGYKSPLGEKDEEIDLDNPFK